MNAFDDGCRRWVERPYALLVRTTRDSRCPEEVWNEALRLLVRAEGLSRGVRQTWWPKLSESERV
jgi:hypothetical protein